LKILKYIEPYIEIIQGLQHKFLATYFDISFIIQELVIGEELLKGYEDDLEESIKLIDETYEHFENNILSLEVSIEGSQNIVKEIVEDIATFKGERLEQRFNYFW